MRHEFIEGPIPNFRASRRYLIASVVVMWLAAFIGGMAVGMSLAVSP